MRRLGWVLLTALLAGCASKATGPRGALHGVVVDGAGTRLRSQDVALAGLDGGVGALEVSITDSLGHYGFGNLAPGSYLVSVITDQSLAAADTVAIPNGEAAPDTLRAAPAGAFYGTTLAGASVAVEGLLALSISDSTGVWTLHGIPPGHWIVGASHAGHADVSAAATIATPPDSVLVVLTFAAPALSRR